MLRSWRSWILACATILFAIWVVGGSKTFQSCMQEDEHKSGKENSIEGAAHIITTISTYKECTGHFVEKNGEGIIAAFTIILAISTIGLWSATNKLWAAGEKQLDLLSQSSAAQSRDMQASIAEALRAATAMENVAQGIDLSAKATQISVATLRERTAMQMRAYVSVIVGSAIFQERDKNLRFEAKPFMVNNGHTPAHDVGYWATAAVMPLPFPEDFDFPLSGPRRGAALLGPQQNFMMSAIVPDYVPDQDVANIKLAKGRALTVWGRITYRDAFGEMRETKFAQILSWLPDDSNITGYWVDRHNDAT